MANEILLMADVLSREKSVDKDIIFEAIEAALATATRKRHREDIEARVSIHRDTGEYDAFRRWEVIDDEEEQNQGLTSLIGALRSGFLRLAGQEDLCSLPRNPRRRFTKVPPTPPAQELQREREEEVTDNRIVR